MLLLVTSAMKVFVSSLDEDECVRCMEGGGAYMHVRREKKKKTAMSTCDQQGQKVYVHESWQSKHTV